MSTCPKSLLLFILCRRKISGVMDLFRERSAWKPKPVIQGNKGWQDERRERQSCKMTELLLFMFHRSGSHYFPPSSPSCQHAALSPARAVVLLPSIGQTCYPQQCYRFAGFRAEKRWSISSPVWDFVLLVQRRAAKERGGRGQKQETPLLWDKLHPSI